MLRRIGAEEGGEFKAVASGTLPSGKPVIVNSDGTVSVPSSTTFSAGFGSKNSIVGDANYITAAYDSANDKLVIAYRDGNNSNYGTAVIGSISGSTVTFGTPVVFSSASQTFTQTIYDSSSGKVVILFYKNDTAISVIVGTVSGTSISFGSIVSAGALPSQFDASGAAVGNSKIVIAYRNNSDNFHGYGVVGTISGTSISFGTAVEFENAIIDKPSVAYDSGNDKVVIAYRDRDNSNYGTAVVGTVSGTSISFGSAATFDTNGSCVDIASAYDANAGKIVIVYEQTNGYAIVGTVSGTSISFGSRVLFQGTTIGTRPGVVYNSIEQKVYVHYQASSNGQLTAGTVSGTSISFSYIGAVTGGSSSSRQSIAFISDQNALYCSFRDSSDDVAGTIYQLAYTQNNLTSENYIGMSRGVVSQAQTIGSPVTFSGSNNAQNIASIFDSSNNKVVITYQDVSNSFYGTAVVGDVSGSSISFGTPVVFESASNGVAALTFDSNSNKVVLAYYDSSNSDYGTSRVGTVSGTSISFGSAAVYESAVSYYNAIDFDSNLNKVVIAYRDQGNSNYGTAVVGTVSGTSISFGTPVVFNAGSVEDCSVIFDSSNNKTVILYKDTANSNYGTAIVGTVSGTSISFGSEVAFNSAATTYPIGIFDPSSSKIVIAFRDEGDSNNGKVMVGTVSGTSISFGSEVLYASGITGNGSGIAYDSENNQIILVYQDATNGTVKTGTVSGSTVTLSSALEFNSVNSTFNRVVFDSNSKVSVISYRDVDNSYLGKALVFKQDIRGEVADGGNASMDIIGSVSDNQSSLTAGQQYFVQTDGTISTTADSPSVLAGTAISATELLVKT